jgi:hypothetical protein
MLSSWKGIFDGIQNKVRKGKEEAKLDIPLTNTELQLMDDFDKAGISPIPGSKEWSTYEKWLHQKENGSLPDEHPTADEEEVKDRPPAGTDERRKWDAGQEKKEKAAGEVEIRQKENNNTESTNTYLLIGGGVLLVAAIFILMRN